MSDLSRASPDPDALAEKIDASPADVARALGTVELDLVTPRPEKDDAGPVRSFGELRQLTDAEFVHAAYRTLFGRRADRGGFLHFVSMLRSAKLSKEAIVRELLASKEARLRKATLEDLPAAPDASDRPVPRFEELRERIGIKQPDLPIGANRVSLVELNALNDTAFVRNTYRVILGREPDASGFAHYLAELRSAGMSKSEIAGHLRYSPEGRARGVRIPGLLPRYVVRRIERIPIIGALLRWIDALIRLPTRERELRRLEAFTVAQIAGLSEQVVSVLDAAAHADGQARSAFEQAIQTLREQLADLWHSKAERHAVEAYAQQSYANLSRLGEGLREVADALRDAQSSLANIDSRLSGVASDYATREALEAARAQLGVELRGIVTRLESADRAISTAQKELQRDAALIKQKASTAALEAATGELRAALEAATGELRAALDKAADELHAALDRATGSTLSPALDAFYSAFEERFRGTRDDIRERVSVYVPLIRDAGAGSDDRPVIDLGCGRGEWLEVLRDSGLSARGVDSSPAMVESSRRLGLDVIEADALTHLHSHPADSIGAITGMHIIEHFAFEKVVALVDESLRALAPGGIVIFETPNPENLQVGACGFYVDPTHKHPLPPSVMSFLLESRGFEAVSIMRLHPHPDWEQLREGEPRVQQVINAALFSEQDYAVVARKPTRTASVGTA
jgi:SAM-dependent methyltransferase